MKRGFSSMEYAVMIGTVVITLVGMSVYVQRALAGKWRSVGDTFGQGRQYGGGTTQPPPPPPVCQAQACRDCDATDCPCGFAASGATCNNGRTECDQCLECVPCA